VTPGLLQAGLADQIPQANAITCELITVLLSLSETLGEAAG
jgi:hypothetical protein